MTRTLICAAIFVLSAATASATPPLAIRVTRLDSHGYPLPQGAVARFGDRRLLFSPINSTVFSADGKRVIRNRQVGIDIREVATGRDVTPAFVRSLRGRILFASQGKLIHVPEGERTYRVLDAGSGREVTSIARSIHTDPILSHDGRQFAIWVAAGQGQYELHACDLVVAEAGWRVALSTATPGRVVFLPGRYIAVNSYQGTVSLFDATGRLSDTHELGSHTGPFWPPTAGTDRGQFVVANNNFLITFRVKDGRLVRGETVLIPGPNLSNSSISLTPDGGSVILNHPGVIQRIELATGRVLVEYRPQETAGLPRAVAPDGRMAVEAGNHEPGRVFDWSTGRTLFQYDELRPVVLLSSVGRDRVAVCDRSTLRVYAVPSGDQSSAHPVPEAPKGTPRGLSADGRRLLVESWELDHGWFTTYDLASARQFFRFEVSSSGGPPRSVVLSPDGSQVLVGWPDRAATFDGATGLEASLEGGRAPLGYSSDGRLISCWGKQACLLVEHASRRTRATLPVADAIEYAAMAAPNQMPFASALRFSRDGRYLAGFRERGVVGVWSVVDGVMVHERTIGAGYNGRVGDISPDGRWIAQASWPVPLVWEWAAPRERSADVRLPGHTGDVQGITFTPDGKYLLTAGQDGTVLVWDMAWVARMAVVRPQHRSDDELWDDLASRDAAVAGRAVGEWVRRQAAAIERFRRELPPATNPDPAAVTALVARLDHDDSATRDAAEAEFARLAELAAEALRPVAERSTSAEQRARARRLLDRLGGVVTDPQRLRVVRAVEVVERVGTPDARRLLADWAAGADRALLTREARAALDRFTER
jgi:WD40 repeat protein